MEQQGKEREKLIAYKKGKLLQRGLRLKAVESQDQIAQELRKLIRDGADIKAKSAKFVTAEEKEKHFLLKPKHSLEYSFGETLFRALSCKMYASKRVGVFGERVFATKFDKKLFDGLVLQKEPSVEGFFLKEVGLDFLRGYARMCAVVHVLGEFDNNSENIAQSTKTSRPVKIDNSFLVNDAFLKVHSSADRGECAFLERLDRFHIYGSAHSNDFLQIFLAKRTVKCAKNRLRAKREDFKEKKLKGEEAAKKTHQAFLEAYNDGIDKDLLQEILEKDAQNQEILQEFTNGILDAIELAKDEDFLTQLVQKYQEIDGDLYKITLKHKEIFQDNAKRAEKDFACFIEHFQSVEAPDQSCAKPRIFSDRTERLV